MEVDSSEAGVPTRVESVARWLATLSALAIVVLMIAVCVDVVVRTLTGASLPGMVELAESCLVVAVYLGLAWAMVRGEHVAVTLLTDRLGVGANRVLAIVAGALSVVLLAWLALAVTDRAIEATAVGEERFGIIRWPMWPLRWAIVVGIVAILVVAALQFVDALRGRAHVVEASHDA